MKFFPLRGRAGRVPATSRRRPVRFAPSMGESLEDRRLLAAGSYGLNVELDPVASMVNLLQVQGRWTTVTAQESPLTYNTSGDPTNDAALIFDERVNAPWDGPDPNAIAPNLTGTYQISFNGQATIIEQYAGTGIVFTIQNQSYNAATNTTTASLVVPASSHDDYFGITFENTQATPTSGLGTGFSNAKLIRPGYSLATTQIYTNEFVSALAPYSVLRYLDPEATNSQPFLNGNTLVTVDAPQVDQTGDPWEELIALANQTNTDMWVNVPEGATNAYVAAMANIFKNGGTVNGVAYPGLNSNLKVYLEYSNEVWGGIPTNEYYQQAAVQNSATNQPLSTFPSNLDVYTNTDGTTSTDVNTAVGRRYLERTADIGQIFQSVMGADPTHQRIRPVLGWQENNSQFYPGALDWYEHFFGPASTAFYGMGDAAYMNPTTYSSVDAVIASLQAQEAAYSIPDTSTFALLANKYGLKYVSYEGGPAISGDNVGNDDAVALAASRDPRMEQLVYQHAVNFFANGGTLSMMYSGPFSIWSPANEWSVAELGQYGNPTASSKYRGTVDVANASPVAVTVGVPVSAVAPITISAATDAFGNNFFIPTTGQKYTWILNAASSEVEDLKMTTDALAGVTPGQIQVFLDEQPVGSPINVTPSSTIDLGSMTLSAGLHGLTILVLNGINPALSNPIASQFQAMTFTFTPLGFTSLPVPIPGDSSFESVSVGNGYAYSPTGSAWTFSGSIPNGSGLTGNNSAFTQGNPAAPQGSQVAFLQEKGSILQSLAGWSAGTYTIAFDAARRGNYGGSEDFEVLVDGNVVGTFKPTSTSYVAYTTGVFAVSAGSHVIQFLGLNSAGGDNTAFLDAVTLAVAAPSTIPTVGDSGFESIVVGNGFDTSPTGSAWIFSGGTANSSGVSGNNSGFTQGNPAAPQGSQVAYIHQQGSIAQLVAGWAAGTYTIAFDAAQRAMYNGLGEDFEVLVDSNVVGTFKPSTTSYLAYTTASFTIKAGSHVIQFIGLDTVGGDNTTFLDAVSVAAATTIPPTVPTVGDSGFESVSVGNGYAYSPTGSAWTFSGSSPSGSGLTGNYSAFTQGNPAAPQGSQVAFLQEKGSILQSVSGWSAGSYAISFDAAQRASYNGSGEDFEVLVDGVVVGTFKPSTTSYLAYTTSVFTVTAGSHAVQFLGLDTAGGDNTTFLDAVSVAVATTIPPTVPTVGDSGFESVSVGNGYAYSPTGSAWTFSGSSPSGSGLTGNYSAFTQGNPAAPQGSQVAFLQEKGSILQSVSGWSAGSYAISFDAAQRASYNGSGEDFEVLVDGVVVGTFKPSTTSYLAYTTSVFTVTAGSHAIQFLGLDTAGGDNTTFLDAVSVSAH